MAKVNLTIMWIDFRYSTDYSRHSPLYNIPAKAPPAPPAKKNSDVGFHVKLNGFNLLTF